MLPPENAGRVILGVWVHPGAVMCLLPLLLSCEGAKPHPGDDTGTPLPHVEFGLDERPENPACMAPDRPASGADVLFTRVYSGVDLQLPVSMTHPDGDDTWWYVVEQGGTILRFAKDPDTTTIQAVVDLTDRVSHWQGINEDGLLGMAFHPDFASNGFVYLNYTAGTSNNGRSVVARYHSADGGRTLDVDSEKVILTVDQPYVNHNGGHVAFGPDGYLYVGFGDGGSGGDPEENGQDTEVLLAKMLRIDVDGGDPYLIPSDNPFAAGGGAPEIFAWGLRNPWRYSFDRETGRLWVGDVGQDAWEEVDVVELGGNYGWNEKEGTHCYDHATCEGPYLDPVVEYSHSEGDSVTGGVVYRGTAIPSLVGTYLYADAYQGKVWGLFFDEDGIAAPAILDTLAAAPVHFAEDGAGEVYILDYFDGNIFRMDPAGKPVPDTFPQFLSETGCVDTDDPSRPASGLIPYGVNNPLWSDGAEKARWFAIPDGTVLTVEADGSFTWPVGSVLMKQFAFAGRPVETRLLMLHDDGAWAGYTYQWNETGSDAELLPADRTVEFEGHTWTFPSRSQCLQCHTSAAGRVLGPRIEQLNGEFPYEVGIANQIKTLDHIGMFATSPGDPAELPALPTPDGPGTVDEKARAYLASNCAMCHRPEGTGGGVMDYRYEVSFAETRTCGEEPVNGDLGVEGSQILMPGDPGRSVLSLRMHTLLAQRMPPVGTAVVDDEGVATVDSWIESLSVCP